MKTLVLKSQKRWNIELNILVISYIKRLYNNEIAARLLNGGFWSLAGAISSKLVILLTSIIVAHILGKIQYGEYSIIRTTIFMFIAFASLGVGAASTKYIAQYRNFDLQKAYNTYLVTSVFSTVFGIITAIVVFFTAEGIATEQLNEPNISIAIQCGAVLLMFCTVNGSQSGALAGFEDFKHIALNNFISSILELICVFIGAIYFCVEGAILGSGIGYVLLTILNHLSISKHFKKYELCGWRRLKLGDFRIIWEFGLPAALCNLLVIFALWYSRTYLVKLGGFGEIAIYNVADQIKALILFIPGALSQMILPMLTNIRANGQIGTYNKIFSYNVIINVVISTVLSIVIGLLAPFILGLWGESFVEPLPLILLAASTIFSSFATVVGQAIASQGKMWMGLLCNLIWSTIVLALSLIFVNNGLGATGLALAILISYVIHGGYQYVYLRYYLLKNNL